MVNDKIKRGGEVSLWEIFLVGVNNKQIKEGRIRKDLGESSPKVRVEVDFNDKSLSSYRKRSGLCYQ